jgi:hypothetical protein
VRTWSNYVAAASLELKHGFIDISRPGQWIQGGEKLSTPLLKAPHHPEERQRLAVRKFVLTPMFALQ